jgi:adenylate kinase
MNLIMLGPPGAGKGTQAALLAERTGMPHVATGDLFRTALKEETELGLTAKSYMERGELVPDEVTVAMVRERLLKSDCDGGVILDGFPRSVQQAEALEGILDEQGKTIDAALFIDAEEVELVRRLSSRVQRHLEPSPSRGEVRHLWRRPVPAAGRCPGYGEEQDSRLLGSN